MICLGAQNAQKDTRVESSGRPPNSALQPTRPRSLPRFLRGHTFGYSAMWRGRADDAISIASCKVRELAISRLPRASFLGNPKLTISAMRIRSSPDAEPSGPALASATVLTSPACRAVR